MGIDGQRLTAEERANLVAYLDQELDPDSAAMLASKLTNSVSGRRDLDILRKTFELLDLLPRPQTPADFASRTVTRLADQAEGAGQVMVRRVARVTREILYVGLVGLMAVAGFAAAHAAVRWLVPDPTARLVRDLSLSENLDAYRAVGTMEFLRALDDLPEFHQKPGVATRFTDSPAEPEAEAAP